MVPKQAAGRRRARQEGPSQAHAEQPPDRDGQPGQRGQQQQPAPKPDPAARARPARRGPECDPAGGQTPSAVPAAVLLRQPPLHSASPLEHGHPMLQRPEKEV